MKKKGSGIFSTIGYIVVAIFLGVSIALWLIGIIFGHDVAGIIMLIGFALFLVFSLISLNTKSGKITKKEIYGPEVEERKKNKEDKERQADNAIYQYTYQNKPITFTERQKFLFDDAFNKASQKLVQMGGYRITLADNMTKEELYTLWFESHSDAPLDVYTMDGTKVRVYTRIQDFEVIIDESAESALMPYKTEVVSLTPAPEKKKRMSKINAQRKAHKAAKKRKKEAKEKHEAEIAKKREARRHQPPNYEFLAKEWVSKNIGYVNKMLKNGTIAGEKFVNARLEYDKLPEDHVTWNLIVKKLKEDGVICRYEIDDKGINIKALAAH